MLAAAGVLASTGVGVVSARNLLSVQADRARQVIPKSWDVPPRAEGQAELLSRLRPISAAECAVLLPEVAARAAAPTAEGPAASAPAAATASVFTDPQAFLLQVMNDERVEMALRIEAAKALLGASPARSRATGAAGATSTPRRKSAAPEVG